MFLKKLKMELPYYLAIPILGIYPKETQYISSKEYMHPCVHCSIVYNNQAVQASQVPITRQLNQKAVVHIYNGILLSHIKEQNLTICNSMNRPRGYYAQ